MKKSFLKKVTAIVMGAMMILPMCSTTTFAKEKYEVRNYVALGDSIGVGL